MKIYLICGKARSGKDTVASIIEKELSDTNKVCRIGLTRTLKGYIKDYFGWDGNEDTKPRTLLQEMGQDIIKDNINFHIDRLCEDINVLSKYFDVFVVSDIRLIHEIEEIRNRFDNVTVIGVIKENYVSPLSIDEEKHITEHDLDNYDDYDYKVINKDLEGLEKEVKEIIGGND